MNKAKQIFKQIGQDFKQRISIYPYYPVICKYQQQQNQNLLIFTVQYPNNIAILSFILFNKQLNKKTGISSIDLAGFNDREVVSIIQQSLKNVSPIEGVFMIGYRSGHLVMLKFKDKKTQIIHKFNKYHKKQGFFSKTSSFISGQDTYKPLIPEPIKTALYNPSRKYNLSYLIGNTLILYRSKQQHCQQQIRQLLKSQQYYNKKHIGQQSILLNQNNWQICTYNYTQKQQILISFSMQSIIKCYSAKNLQNLYSIILQMPIRKVNHFYFNQQNQYITIMPYEDYVILVDIKRKLYSKLLGHRCFIANSIVFNNQVEGLILLSAGMDHRVCFHNVNRINKWHNMISSQQNIIMEDGNNLLKINQNSQGIDFQNRYSLGEYSNARTNNHDYGFSDLIFGNPILALPTYDSRIKYFALYYK